MWLILIDLKDNWDKEEILSFPKVIWFRGSKSNLQICQISVSLKKPLKVK